MPDPIAATRTRSVTRPEHDTPTRPPPRPPSPDRFDGTTTAAPRDPLNGLEGRSTPIESPSLFLAILAFIVKLVTLWQVKLDVDGVDEPKLRELARDFARQNASSIGDLTDVAHQDAVLTLIDAHLRQRFPKIEADQLSTAKTAILRGMLDALDVPLSPDPEREAMSYESVRGPLFVDGPQRSDVAQGHLGDCGLLAAIGELADHDPQQLRRIIRENRDGTYTVTLTTLEMRGEDVVRVPVKIRVSNRLPDNVVALDNAHGQRELWPAIIEKAMAVYIGHGRYGERAAQEGLVAFRPHDAFLALGGRSALEYRMFDGPPRTDDDVYTLLHRYCASGLPVVIGTVQQTRHLYGQHAYQVVDVFESNGARFIKLKNPHGHHSANDGELTVRFDRFMQDLNVMWVANEASPP